MQTTEIIWHNGELIPWAEAKIHVLSHSLHYGGGAFEGIRFYKTAKGPAIFRLPEHVDRLMFSTKILHMKVLYSATEISEAIQQVVRVNKIEQGYIRPLFYFGYGKMGVHPGNSPVELVIACWPWGAYLPVECIDIKTSSFMRIHPSTTVISAKLTGHYLNGILASLELQGTHYHEALFLDNNGYIAEGVGENFFMIKNGILYTPKLGTVLSGITRDTIINLAAKLDIQVIEADLTLEQAYAADEAFFTGTAAEVTAIRSIDDKVLGKGEIGPMTTQIKQNYLDIVHGKNAEFLDYLTYV